MARFATKLHSRAGVRREWKKCRKRGSGCRKSLSLDNELKQRRRIVPFFRSILARSSFFSPLFSFFFPLRVFLARWIFINLLVQAVGSESASGAASFDVPRRAFLHRVPFTPFLAAYSAQGESSKCRSHRDPWPIENFDDR